MPDGLEVLEDELLSDGVVVEPLLEDDELLSEGVVELLEDEDGVLVDEDGAALLPLVAPPECSGAAACSSRESLPSLSLSSVAKSFSWGVPATSSRDR
ncbi:MAG TPA: hypothetical protein VHL85_11975 [Burkholderiales bacterium]|nr:hypothetical protein [Burkholderiales bacterium]